MSEIDNEIEARVQKQTKTERIINIFLLFCAIFFSGYLIFYYTQPDYEYLNFARLAVYPITGIFGMIIGAYLVAVISSKSWVKKPKSLNLFFLLFIIPCVALFTLLIITLALTDPFVILNMFLPTPNDYLSALLSISAVMFFYGALISFVCLYIDEIAEKFKKEKSGNEIETNVQKQTKTERLNCLLILFCAIFYCVFLIFFYIRPDPEYLESARTAGGNITFFFGLIIGMFLISVISGKKRVKASQNIGLAIFLVIIFAVVFLIIMFTFYDSFFIYRGEGFHQTDPNNYLRILLSCSGLAFVVGIFGGLMGLYIDDFVEKYFKGMKF